MHCLVYELSFADWPYRDTPAHAGRFDNINSCLRAFGSEDSAGDQPNGRTDKDKVLRDSLGCFAFYGPPSPMNCSCFVEIDAHSYKSNVCSKKQAALTDVQLAKEISCAWESRGSTAPNGLKLDDVTHASKCRLNVIQKWSSGRPLIIILSPDGVDIVGDVLSM